MPHAISPTHPIAAFCCGAQAFSVRWLLAVAALQPIYHHSRTDYAYKHAILVNSSFSSSISLARERGFNNVGILTGCVQLTVVAS
ncbi:unnamed protein product [Ceratitis capitata]|uniref:(Mediterranean fruit fly) hypothetical protein n=1 Tax=Ceratitis capitata TaxID=7213 RepID=A0A811V8B0_CERCA|nr:unnamed protein product [Ceratitis capitata]